MADLVNQGIIVGDMLCPANPVKLNEKYNDLLGLVSTGANSCVVLDGSPPRTEPDGSLIVNPCRRILGTYPGGTPLSPGDPQRREIIEEEIFNNGYNTNYAASWFLVRGGLLLDANGNLTGPDGCPISNKEVTSTEGPLRRAILDVGTVAATHVPLLACAAAGDVKEAILSEPIGPHKQGERLCESFTDGPVLKTTMRPPTFSSNTTYSGAQGWWAVWNKQTLQDYRDFGAVHSGGAQSCNVLFADGSVRPIVDRNGDGMLNNGFDPSQYEGEGVIGFQDAEVEIGRQDIYSRWSLTKASKGNLDTQ